MTSCCSKLSFFKKILILLGCLAVVAAITIAVIFLRSENQPSSQNGTADIATTERPIMTSKPSEVLNQTNHDHPKVLDPLVDENGNKPLLQKCEVQKLFPTINESVSACKDFYSFVCGGHRVESEPNKSEENILEASETSEALMSVKNFQRACIRKTTVTEGDRQTLIEIINQLGGWSVLNEIESDENDDLDWIDLTKKLGTIGYDAFWHMNPPGIISNPYPTTSSYSNILNDDSSSYGMELTPRKTIFQYGDKGVIINDSEEELSIRNRIKNITVILGLNHTLVEKILNDFFDFDEKLSALTRGCIHNPRMTYRSFSTSHETVQSMDIIYTWMNWTEYFTGSLLFPPYAQIQDLTIYFQFVHDMNNPLCGEYIEHLPDVINRTPKSTVASYTFLRFIDDLISFIDNSKNSETMGKDCENFVENRLALASDAIYVRRHLTKDVSKKVLDLADSIRRQVMNELKEHSNMSLNEDSKQRFINKLEKIPISIGYPDEFFDDTKIEEYYQGLTINDGDFLEGFLNYTRYRVESFNRSLDLHQKWISLPIRPSKHPPITTIKRESVDLPTTLLQSKYFHDENLMFLNYAGLGRYIARNLLEVTSATVYWMIIEDQVSSRKDIVLCQWNAVNNTPLNLTPSINSLRIDYYERVSLKIAYEQYQKWVNTHHISKSSCIYSNDQIFWMYAMQTMKNDCNDIYEKSAVILDNTHFLVLPKFCQDFNCPDLFTSCPKGDI